MERPAWLKEKRRIAEARYDTHHAASYDQNWGHYPALEQVRTWMSQASFSILEEGEGDDYQHFLARKA